MTEINKKSFGKRLKQARKDKNLTSEKLSELCHCNAVYIRQLESGTRTPSLPMFITLCNILQISPSHLLGTDLTFPADDKVEYLISSLKTLSPKQIDIINALIHSFIESE